jgi:hypothetical protein
VPRAGGRHVAARRRSGTGRHGPRPGRSSRRGITGSRRALRIRIRRSRLSLARVGGGLVRRMEFGRIAADLRRASTPGRVDGGRSCARQTWRSRRCATPRVVGPDVTDRVRSISEPRTWSAEDVVGVLRRLESTRPGWDSSSSTRTCGCRLDRAPCEDAVFPCSTSWLEGIGLRQRSRRSRPRQSQVHHPRRGTSERRSGIWSPTARPKSCRRVLERGLEVVVGDARCRIGGAGSRRRDALISAMALPAAGREFEPEARTIVEPRVSRRLVVACADVRRPGDHRRAPSRGRTSVSRRPRSSGSTGRSVKPGRITDGGRRVPTWPSSTPGAGRRLAAADFATFARRPRPGRVDRARRAFQGPATPMVDRRPRRPDLVG